MYDGDGSGLSQDCRESNAALIRSLRCYPACTALHPLVRVFVARPDEYEEELHDKVVTDAALGRMTVPVQMESLDFNKVGSRVAL